jgi:very-short-patch-repair endonuclease
MTIRKAGKAVRESDPTKLARMATSRDYYVRSMVADNSSTPVTTLRALAADPDDGVRGHVARNPRTPPDVLATLGDDDSASVILGLARNPATPSTTLHRIINQHGYFYRALEEVARNDGASDEVRIHLAVYLATKPDPWANRAHHPVWRMAGVLSSDNLRDLATHSDESVRQLVAGHPSCAAETLAALARDPSSSTRLNIARSEAAPAHLLAQLASDTEWTVREAAWSNPNCPKDAQARALASLLGTPEFLAKHPTAAMHAEVSSQGATFDSAVEQLFWNSSQSLLLAPLLGLTPQYKVGRYRLDFALPAQKVGIEIDGLAYHSGQEAFIADRKRERELEMDGWRLLRFAAQEVMSNADGCVRQAARWVERQGGAR